MSTRNLYLRGSNGGLELLTPRGLAESENNVFDKAFTTEPTDIEWNDWMRWEGGIGAPLLDRKHSGSTNSSQENWCSDIEGSASFMADNDFSFDDAPYELDETARPSQGGVFGAGGEAIATAFGAPQERPYRGYSSLTQAEEQTLQNIAMPYLLSKVKISSEPSSPTASHSSHSSHSASPSPEPETRARKNKKRKSVIEDDDVPTALCMSRKRGHNAIEKRYRTNLNDKINCLRQGVPSLARTSSSESNLGDEEEDEDAEGVDSKTGQQKYGKAAILTRALEYIQHLEMTTERLGSEVTVLKTRVGAFEKLAMSGSIIINGGGAVRLSEPIVKSETLLTIQAEFKSIKPHAAPTKPVSTRRRSSKNHRGC